MDDNVVLLGYVTDGDGNPVEGVEVWVSTLQVMRFKGTNTNADGYFQFIDTDGIGQGHVRLEAFGDDQGFGDTSTGCPHREAVTIVLSGKPVVDPPEP